MKIAWVTRSFLDYRIPVFAELDRLCGGELHLFFSGEYVPASVAAKAQAVLGERAHPLLGEWRLGTEDGQHLANRNFSIRYQPGIPRLLRRLKPDVMVCDGFFKWTLPCLWVRMRHGVPLVVCYERTAHTERHVQGIRTRYRRWALRYIDAMNCSGSLCREYAVSLGMPADRIATGHMVADVERLAARRGEVSADQRCALRRQHGLDGVVLLYVGRLHPRKGVAELLLAWGALDPRLRAGASLLLVGEGPSRADLAALCEAQGLGTVRFAGAVPYDDLPAYYAAADAFVIPTLEDNWSLVVPEAMAAGLPVLCSQYNGCWPELVPDGRTGWVFDPLDMDGAGRVLARCVAAAGGLAAMGRAAAALVRQHGPSAAAATILHSCHTAVAWRRGAGVAGLPGNRPEPSASTV